jgi:hypothetical protein
MEYYQHLYLDSLPLDVRGIVLAAVRTLIERGPHGLVEDGLCPLEAEQSMVASLSDYPGQLIDPPGSAELWGHANADGIWTIDLPLHNDREGRMDLFLFLEVNSRNRAVEVTGLYTP